MPIFEVIPLAEAQMKGASGRQGRILREYAEYIEQVEEGQAGKLSVRSDENATSVRRRLQNTASLLQKELVIRRTERDIYFWPQTPEDIETRRSRRRRSQST